MWRWLMWRWLRCSILAAAGSIDRTVGCSMLLCFCGMDTEDFLSVSCWLW